jgi:hypothetical protein
MKKYILIMAVGALFCMFQVQPSEKSLRAFKHMMTEDVAKSGRMYNGHSGLNSWGVEDVASFGKDQAIEKRIPLNKAASIVINTLTQRAFDDLKDWEPTNQSLRKLVFDVITEKVNNIFGLN